MVVLGWVTWQNFKYCGREGWYVATFDLIVESGTIKSGVESSTIKSGPIYWWVRDRVKADHHLVVEVKTESLLRIVSGVGVDIHATITSTTKGSNY